MAKKTREFSKTSFLCKKLSKTKVCIFKRISKIGEYPFIKNLKIELFIKQFKIKYIHTV